MKKMKIVITDTNNNIIDSKIHMFESESNNI